MIRSLLVVAVLSGSLMAAPQDGPLPAPPSPSVPTFVATTELVVLHVNVQDRRGNFLSDLPAQAFSVFEEGRPQRISLFLREEGPVTAGLIVDDSMSMFSLRDRVIEAAVAFAKAARPEDELFAIAFNEQVRPILKPSMPFTSDPVVFERALSNGIVTRGRTALFDAVIAGLDYLQRGAHQRKVLVIIGDGGDNESRHTFSDVLRRAQASNVLVHTVGLIDPLDKDADPDRLEQLARATGGEMFAPETRRGVYDVLQRISADIRHTYTLGYDPGRPPDGSFRTVTVRVTAPKDVRTVVRTRTGYRAVAPGPEQEGPRGDAQ